MRNTFGSSTYNEVKVWLTGSMVAIGDSIGWHLVLGYLAPRSLLLAPRCRSESRLSAREFAGMPN